MNLSQRADECLLIAQETYVGIQEDFKKIYERADKKLKRLYEKWEKDITDVIKTGEEKIEKVIDDALSEGYLRDLGEAVVDYAKSGSEKSRKILRQKLEQYSAKLDEEGEKHSEIVGLWDGVVEALLAVPANRRPEDKSYKVHVKYGFVVGMGASIPALWLGLSRTAVVVGGLPYATRSWNYLVQKVKEAKAEVRADVQAEPETEAEGQRPDTDQTE